MDVMSSILWGFFHSEVGNRPKDGQAALPENNNGGNLKKL